MYMYLRSYIYPSWAVVPLSSWFFRGLAEWAIKPLVFPELNVGAEFGRLWQPFCFVPFVCLLSKPLPTTLHVQMVDSLSRLHQYLSRKAEDPTRMRLIWVFQKYHLSKTASTSIARVAKPLGFPWFSLVTGIKTSRGISITNQQTNVNTNNRS